jgi:hypothetical protein
MKTLSTKYISINTCYTKLLAENKIKNKIKILNCFQIFIISVNSFHFFTEDDILLDNCATHQVFVLL